MQRNDNTPEMKAVKTALLLAAINLVTTPAYCVSGSTGLLISLATNLLSLFGLHQLGKERRPFANGATRGWSFFSSLVDLPSYDLDNARRNVITGGAAVADEIVNTIVKFCKPK